MLPEGWALVYMGWGTLKPELEQLTALVDPQGRRIRFVPPVAQTELAQWTADATIGVILYEPHSLNHIFCSPNKLWEYPRSGVPVLVSEAPEMVKRIQQHGYGWVLPSNRLSPHRVARFIEQLSDEEIAAAKARCGPFLDVDNWSVYEARLLEIYARLSA
jgi:glycosyltransferase involved in cell wall biosynthesis